MRLLRARPGLRLALVLPLLWVLSWPASAQQPTPPAEFDSTPPAEAAPPTGQPPEAPADVPTAPALEAASPVAGPETPLEAPPEATAAPAADTGLPAAGAPAATVPPAAAPTAALPTTTGDATPLPSPGTQDAPVPAPLDRDPDAVQASDAPLDVKQQVALLRETAEPTTLGDRFMSLVGLVVLVGLAWLLSVNRRAVDLRLVGIGIGLQILFGLLVLKTRPGLWLFDQLNDLVVVLLGFTQEGVKFLFGSFVTGQVEPAVVNFTFNVLPTIIFFSSLMTLLYYLGVMQHVVNFMAWVMQKTMRTSGSETLSCAANIFVGQTEAPLVVKPYVATMTKSELHAIMTGGFATVAGGVMAAYVGMLQNVFPDIAGHLIAASVMSAPAALVISKIMFPETEQSLTRGHVKMNIEKIDVNAIDAAARGAGEGLTLALNVGAMLLAFIALVAMLNALLGLVGGWLGFENLSLQLLLGYLLWPLAWVMGIPSSDCFVAGQLIGEKTVLNEFIAYLHLTDVLKTPGELSYRSVVILTYALCGFSNFSSIAIQIGGIGGIAPSRRHDLARIGLRAMIAGSIACFMTATVAGLLI